MGKPRRKPGAKLKNLKLEEKNLREKGHPPVRHEVLKHVCDTGFWKYKLTSRLPPQTHAFFLDGRPLVASCQLVAAAHLTPVVLASGVFRPVRQSEEDSPVRRNKETQRPLSKGKGINNHPKSQPMSQSRIYIHPLQTINTCVHKNYISNISNHINLYYEAKRLRPLAPGHV